MFDIWFGSTALLFLAALVFLWPLLTSYKNRGVGSSVSQQSLNVAVYKDRVSELQRDKHNGIITDEQFTVLKAELESGLLIDVAPDESLSASDSVIDSSKLPRMLLLMVLILLPVLTWGLYWKWGAYDTVAESRNPNVDVAAEGMPAEEIEDLLNTLQQRLQDNPENIDGWILLGRSYMNMNRYREAVESFGRVAELMEAKNEDPSAIYGMIGQALFFENQGMSDEVLAVIRKAMDINPDEVNSLGLLGMYAFDQAKYAEAITYWQRILKVVPEHPSREAIESGIAAAHQALGQTGGAAPLADHPSDDVAQTNGDLASITLNVDISSKLKSQSNETDTLFVYARAVNGPKMPLAIVKMQVKDLPFTVTLDDSMAMGPMAKLSSVKEVQIIARVSKSGTPAPNPGDLEGVITPVKTVGQKESLNITIDRVVQ